MKSLFAVALLVFLSACGSQEGGSKTPAATVKPTAWTNFSGDRAMEDVKAIVALGPRPSGSPEIETSRQYIEKRLKDAGWETRRQDFTAYNILVGNVKMSNIRARFPVTGQDTWGRAVTTLVCSHYDTKLMNGTRFVGANDGGSSTGLLLEVARATAPLPAFAARLELVFFDGEEAFNVFTQPLGFDDDRPDGLFGSRHYASELRKLPKDQLPKHGIVFDMIGDEKLDVEFALNCSPRLIDLAMKSARELGNESHFRRTGSEMIDDHVPLIWLGMEVIDFIDLESFREFWHTSADTLDKLNPVSIEKAGRTGLHFIEKYLSE